MTETEQQPTQAQIEKIHTYSGQGMSDQRIARLVGVSEALVQSERGPQLLNESQRA